MAQRDFARHLRRYMTETEQRLWHHLRAHRFDGHKFRRQQPIGPYIVDFVHFGTRLVVEADGGQHNESRSDAVCDAWLQQQGFQVLRLWNHDILDSPDAVMDMIWRALDERRCLPPVPPLPNPSPARGEGL